MFNPKHILITGASSGIGAALARLYAAPGMRLALHGRNSERLTDVARYCEQHGAKVAMSAGDVTNAAEMAAWIAACHQTQPIDLLVANAGISAGTGGGRETIEQSRAILAVNLDGVLNTVRPAIDLMRGRRRGQIAIMSSLAGFRGLPGAPSYAASKAAVRVYGEALRAELAPNNVEVNVICPGFVRTPMTAVNRFTMPMIMDVERAALIIRDGLAQNRARIAFPWPMYFLVRLFAALPDRLVTFLAGKLPRKPAQG